MERAQHHAPAHACLARPACIHPRHSHLPSSPRVALGGITPPAPLQNQRQAGGAHSLGCCAWDQRLPHASGVPPAGPALPSITAASLPTGTLRDAGDIQANRCYPVPNGKHARMTCQWRHAPPAIALLLLPTARRRRSQGGRSAWRARRSSCPSRLREQQQRGGGRCLRGLPLIC